jgi:Type II secretion system (T2SS), protein G
MLNYPPKLLITLLILLLATTLVVAELNSKQARKIIANIPGLAFNPDLVAIKSITPNSNGAIIEAQFATAFRVAKVAGKKDEWQVAEVRLGNGRWEDVELITTAIREEKIRRTRQQLTELATALATYQQQQGRYPSAKDIFQLTDLLVPQYLNRLIREDLWGQPLEYTFTSSGYRLQSHGPDGKPRSNDEIILENGNFQH